MLPGFVFNFFAVNYERHLCCKAPISAWISTAHFSFNSLTGNTMLCPCTKVQQPLLVLSLCFQISGCKTALDSLDMQKKKAQTSVSSLLEASERLLLTPSTTSIWLWVFPLDPPSYGAS